MGSPRVRAWRIFGRGFFRKTVSPHAQTQEPLGQAFRNVVKWEYRMSGTMKRGGRAMESRRRGGSLKVLAVIASVGMFLVNLVGFLDTQTGSALGCGPDWPLCNGAVVPRFGNIHVVIEFLHRAIVSGFALIAVIFVIWAWRRYPASRAVKGFSLLAVGFIFIQSLLGAAAVVWVNPPAILALHLGFGMLAMVGTGLLMVMVFRFEGPPPSRPWHPLPAGVRRLIQGIWIYTFFAIYWGSYVAFRGVGEACTGWPLCSGRLIPPMKGLVWLDFVHRLLAVGLAVLVALLMVKLYRARKERPYLWPVVVVLAFLVLTQILTGANLVLSHLATGPYLLHVGNIMLLFGLLSYLTYLTLEKAPEWSRRPRQAVEDEVGALRSRVPRP